MPKPAEIQSLESVVDPAFRKVVRRHFDLDPVSCKNSDAILPHFSCRVRDDLMAGIKLNPECRVRQELFHDAGKFEHFFLCHLRS